MKLLKKQKLLQTADKFFKLRCDYIINDRLSNAVKIYTKKIYKVEASPKNSFFVLKNGHIFEDVR